MSENQKKNTIVKDALILCVITLIAGLLLGLVYEITKEPIAKAEQDTKNKAYAAIYSDAEEFENVEELNKLAQDSKEYFKGKSYTGTDVSYDFTGLTVDEVVVAKKDDAAIGYIVNVTTPNGYGGNIQIAMGVNEDGSVKGVQILSISETPGLGMNATGEFKDQFAGAKVDGFVHTKNGKSAENEIDAITSATITTQAVTGAVNAGLMFVQEQILNMVE